MTSSSDAGFSARIQLLETLLIWEGRLNNARVRELLKISPVRASDSIRKFRDKHGTWAVWDSRTRSFHATKAMYAALQRQGSQFSPADSLRRYLDLVGLPSALPAHGSGAHICAALPDLGIPKPDIFAALNEAIRKKQGVAIQYRSMRDPAPHERIIYPHSLVRAGRRWHARAFCIASGTFRDYALGRVVATKPVSLPSERFELDDSAWTTSVKLRLKAHPGLTGPQQLMIREEYFNGTVSRVEYCRGALLPYVVQDLRAAIDPEKQIPPDFQLAVDNVEEVRPWLFPHST